LPWPSHSSGGEPPPRNKCQTRLAARRRFPAVPIFDSVKLNRSTVSFRTEPSSYLRTSTLNPQQSQLYDPCRAPYCTIPEFPAFKSSPTFAAIPSPAFVGDPYLSRSRSWLKLDTVEATPSV